MEDYLAEGKLNPKTYSTKAGFLKHFAAWLIEEDLPFTTGEAAGLHRLFKYLDVTYQLPSDTTVRNVLARIYAELHGEVVRELSVSQHKPQCDQLLSLLTIPGMRCHCGTHANKTLNPKYHTPMTIGLHTK